MAKKYPDEPFMRGIGVSYLAVLERCFYAYFSAFLFKVFFKK